MLEGARVVSVSSCAYAPVDFDDINFEKRPYDARIAYGQSKTANALFTLWLDRLGKPLGVRAFSLDPGGMIESGFSRNMTAEEIAASGYVDASVGPLSTPRTT